MCSACDCDPNKIEESVSNYSPTKICRKCGSDPFIVLDGIHVECVGCFMESCNRKIRSTIGKSKLIKNNDAILVAHSGGASSTALLDLIKNSMNYDTRREQKFRPSILHIDTYFANEPRFDDIGSKARVGKLESFLDYTHKHYPDWPIYWSTLETSASLDHSCDDTRYQSLLYSMYDPQGDPLIDPKFDPLLRNTKNRKAFSLATNDLDLTDKQHYIRECTTNLINVIAEKINHSLGSGLGNRDSFKFIFTGSSATQLANNLLVNVILGHGASLNSIVNVCDRRPSVPIFRPMREFSKKEVAFYLRARNLEFQIQVNLATLADRKASIQKAAEAFLNKLYVDYPSTYSTLLRTGDKMQ